MNPAVPTSEVAADILPSAALPPRRDTVHRRLRIWLYFICLLTDFSVFLVIFTASRALADQGATPLYLGVIGAGRSFTAGLGSILGGWLAMRIDGRLVFLAGAVGSILSILVCSLNDPSSHWFLLGYWPLGIALGCVYPPLIGWLNQGDDPHSNHHGVSRRLIFYCVAWNVGMMIGQLAGGTLYEWGTIWTWSAALTGAGANVFAALAAITLVGRLQNGVAVEQAAHDPAIAQAILFKRLGWIANFGGVFGGSMIFDLLPGMVVSLNILPEEHGLLLAAWRAVTIATYLLMHVSKFWHYRLPVSLASQLLGAAGLVVISFATSSTMLLAGLMLLGQLMGFNYFSSLYYSTAGSSQETRAFAAGIHEATLAAGMALGTILGGLLGARINFRLPYALAAGVILVLIVVQILAWRKWRQASGAA